MAKRTAKAEVEAVDMAEVRAVFDQAVADAPDADTRTTRELLREYFTNPEFRSWMVQFMWEQTRAK